LANAATVSARIPRTKVVTVNQAAGVPELLDGFAPGIKARKPYAR
jgi:hypothetical protein